MEIHYPDYYKKFQCTGAECMNTCCTGWKIGIDKATCRTYRHTGGAFGKRLRASVDYRKKYFITNGNFCPFLNEDQLCDIYIHLGKEKMCRTCRDYPRHMEIYGELYEVSLSLSCPEAARLVLQNEKPASFISRVNDRPGKTEEVDEDFLRLLCLVRENMFAVMEDCSMELNLKLAMILGLAHDIQTRIDQGKPKLAKEVLERLRREKTFLHFKRKAAQYANRWEERRQIMSAYLDMMSGLGTIERLWPGKRRKCRHFLSDQANYETACLEFFNYYRDNEYEYKNLVIYFLYVYFLGAVYDRDVYSKVKFAVISALVIQEMGAADFAEKKSFSTDDQIEEAYIFSREMEHSDYNLEKMEVLLSGNGMFSLEKILICVMAR